jgi:hypothetical protein
VIWYQVGDSTFTIGPYQQAWTGAVAGWQQIGVQLIKPITGAGQVVLRLSPTATPSGADGRPAQSQTPSPSFPAPSQPPLRPAVNLLGNFGRPIGSHGTGLDAYVINQYDPCQTPAKGNVAISQTASARLIQAESNRRVFICSLIVISQDAEGLSLVEGTGSTCGTGTAAIVGATTQGNGMQVGANGGFQMGNGQGTVALQNFPSSDVCLLQTGTGRVAGVLTFVWVQ